MLPSAVTRVSLLAIFDSPNKNITTSRDHHLKFQRCMGRSCAAHDRPMPCFSAAFANFRGYLLPKRLGLPYVQVSPDTSSFSASVRAAFQKCPGFNQFVPGKWKIRLLSGFSPFVPDRLTDRYLITYFSVL